jgi:hypothetical protein
MKISPREDTPRRFVRVTISGVLDISNDEEWPQSTLDNLISDVKRGEGVFITEEYCGDQFRTISSSVYIDPPITTAAQRADYKAKDA